VYLNSGDTWTNRYKSYHEWRAKFLSDRLKRKCRVLIITVAFTSVGLNASKGQGIKPVSPTSNVLAQAVQILNLPRESVLKSFPARIQGIVTCFEERSAVFFVQDQSAGIYIQALSSTNQLTAGDRVDISGVTASGLFAPMIDASTVAVNGRGRLPDPRLAAMEEVLSGKLDSQWVQVEGVVQRSFPEWGHWVLDLATGSSHLSVRILNYAGLNTNSWVDARIRVQGVVATHFNSRKLLTGFHLLTPTPDQVEVVDPPAGNRESLPLRSTQTLLSYSRTGVTEHRVRVRGIVVLQWPERFLILKDEFGTVRVETEQSQDFDPGDIVEAIGFPTLESQIPGLENSQVEFIGKGAMPLPIPLSLENGMPKDKEGELVQIEATLLGEIEIGENLNAIALQAGDHLFQAYVPKNSGLSSAWWPHVTGSLVKVTGIWIRETEGAHGTRPGGPMLLMQSSKDLFVKGPSPSKRSFFLIWTIAGVLLTFLLVYSWTVFVRKRIEKRTSSIRMQALAVEERFRDLFENANDIIFTHDLSGRITSINQAVERILGFSCDEIIGRSIGALAAPRERGRVEEFIEDCLRGNTAREFQFEATAKSGDRVNLDITTRMQHQNGSVSGVKGIARDVTTKRNVEEALRRSEKQLRQSSEAQERLARDLHDNVIQSIYAVGLNLDDCRRTIGSDISHIDTRLAKVVAQLNAVIRDIRDFLSGLRPRSITGAEIEPALRSIATSFGDSFLKCVRFSIDPEAAEHLTSKQATQVLHIAREAISNSVRHAAAENTELSLIIIDGSITFEIQDNGVGFNSGKPKHEGSGLRNMADRARELGASFKLESQPGKGTRVFLEIPT